ncbi:hypothetical protein Pelo_2408 [Pelomyxa schiedti]|nr:hypothetical protein Pelo_2408 [Pelomyxa schiedti]
MSKFFSFLKATANSALDKAGDAMSQALDQLATDTMLQPQPTMSSMSPLSGTGATPWADPRRAPIIPTPAKTSPATHNRGLHTSPTTGGSTATSTQSKQEPIVGHERAPSTNEKHQQKRQVHAIGTPKLVAEPTAPTVKIAPQPLMALPSTSRKSNDSTPFFKDIFSLSAIGQLLETTPVPLTIPDDLLCGINYFAGRDLLNNYSVMITGIRKNHLRIGRRVAQAESKAPILMDRTKTEVIELHKLHQELQALPRICKAVDLMRKQIMDTAVSMQELEARVSVQCELFAADQLEGWKQQQRKKLILYKDMKREKIQDEEMSIRRDLGLPLLPSAQTHSPSPQNVEEEVTSKPSSDTNKHKKISHSHTHHQKHSHTKTGTSYKSAHKQSHSPNRVGTPQSSSKYHPTTPVSSSAPTPKPKPTTESLEKLVIEQDPYLLDKFLSHHTKTNKRKHARTSSSSDSSVSSNSDTDSHSAPDSS